MRKASSDVAIVVLLGVLPAALLAAFLAVGLNPTDHQTIDFRVFWNAADTFLHRGNPYPTHLAALTWKSGAQHSFVYPPPIAVVLAPLLLFPYHAAASVFVVASAAAVAAALWLLDVRDWRCYGAVFLWPAVLTAVSIGTLTPLLLLGVAVVWRYRNALGIAALAAAAVVAAKLFLWPVVVWLWATGRRGTAAAAVAVAVAASAASWAWIRFAGMTGYPNLLRHITEIEAPYGYGAAWIVGGALLVAGLSLAFLVLCGVLRRDDRVLFSVAIIAALVLTPILWLHYLCLLAAPVALVRPRFSPVWVVPAVLWLTPQQQAFDSPWRIAAVLLVLAAVLAATLSPRRPQPEIGDNVPNPAPWPSPVQA